MVEVALQYNLEKVIIITLNSLESKIPVKNYTNTNAQKLRWSENANKCLPTPQLPTQNNTCKNNGIGGESETGVKKGEINSQNRSYQAVKRSWKWGVRWNAVLGQVRLIGRGIVIDWAINTSDMQRAGSKSNVTF